MTLSKGGVENYEQYTDEATVAEFDNYEAAVEFCKAKLDELADYVATYEERNPIASEYRPQDAFWNGGGDMKIIPSPGKPDDFNSSQYFYEKFGL